MRRSEYRLTRGRIPTGFAPVFVSFLASTLFDVQPAEQTYIDFGVSVAFEATPTSASYSPADEGSAVLNIDISDAATLTLTSGNTRIADAKNKISGVAWLTPVNDTPYEATGLNGKPCLHPLVTGDRLQTTTDAAVIALFDAPVTANDYTIFIVTALDVAAAANTLFSAGNTASSSSNTRTFGSVNVTGGKLQVTQTAPAAGSLTGTTVPSTSMQVHCYHGTGGTQRVQLDNGTDEPASGSLSPVGIAINQCGFFARVDSGPDGQAACRFAEAWIFSAELDSSARTRVYNYLASKWA